jgi:hypothetical protein
LEIATMGEKRGPYKKREIDLAELERLASLGLNLGQSAAAMGFTRDTFDRRKDQNPEIADAFYRGRAKGVEEVASLLINAARLGDVGAMRHFLSTVGDWHKTAKVELAAAPTLRLVLQGVENPSA